MNKRSMAMLEKAYAVEVAAAVSGGTDILQTKSRVAEILAEDGYLIKAEATIPGRFPVKIEGYRLTHAGRLTYCASC